MSIPCRVTQETNEHYDRQEAVAANVDLLRAERVREDRQAVRTNAAQLLSKQPVKGRLTLWRGDVYLGFRYCTWNYSHVVERAREDDEFDIYAINLTLADLTIKQVAANKLAEIIRKAALSIAFESLDINDIWNDVDHLMSWEPEQ